MSPVHRSSSNVDTSNAALASGSVYPPTQDHYSEGEEDELDDVGIYRSFSMPPAMFDGGGGGEGREVSVEGSLSDRRPSRDRGRSGICIQRNQGSRRHRKIQESRSEEELTTSGGGREGGEGDQEREEKEEEEEEEVGGRKEGELTGSYPRGRRNAFHGTRVVRRATCAADGSYGTTVAAAAAAASVRIAATAPAVERRAE